MRALRRYGRRVGWALKMRLKRYGVWPRVKKVLLRHAARKFKILIRSFFKKKTAAGKRVARAALKRKLAALTKFGGRFA